MQKQEKIIKITIKNNYRFCITFRNKQPNYSIQFMPANQQAGIHFDHTIPVVWCNAGSQSALITYGYLGFAAI